MIVTSLLDNISDPTSKVPFLTDRGFSVHIKTKNKRILIDCGESFMALLHNAKKKNIDLRLIDILIISHHHFDHIGGIWDFLIKINRTCKVYLKKPNFGLRNYIKLSFIPISIGLTDLDVHNFEKFKDRFVFLEGPQKTEKIDDEITLILNFENSFKKPYTNNLHYQYVCDEGKYEPEDFFHELAVLISPKDCKECVLVSPCSHSGIINITRSCLKFVAQSDEKRLVNVIGGFHLGIDLKGLYLYSEYEEVVKKIGEFLRDQKEISGVWTCHCSTFWGYKIMKKVCEKMKYLYAGKRIEIQ